ncbi:MAG: SSS family solute:Na+ symporter/sodium/pantothenate symporter [Bacteriovoracaceae bacterium]|jgi:SSS family solute:Na+ symporter/sodium/pantothenate symporter
MNAELFKYLLIFLFIGVTYWLSLKGMRKTSDLKSFSIGKGDMSPYMVGLTLSASISSTATFVINPGFVFTHGLSAFLHYAVAASLGVAIAFISLTKKFRFLGEKQGALTIPHWISTRYKSKELGLLFAVMNLLSITFVVLIMVGCSLLVAGLFPVSQKMALIMVMLFVFSYVLMGGSYAHAYTNTLQGIVMLGISVFLFIYGYSQMEGGLINNLEMISPSFASVFNTESSLYYDFFSVFLSSFIVTFALMLQPHILTKVLFLKDDKQVNKFLMTALGTGGIFSLMLFIGFFARFDGLEVPRQDAVVVTYITETFKSTIWGQYFTSLVSVGLLAAGLSTLDGILVSLSSMVVNDIYDPWISKKLKLNSLNLSRVVLVVIGLISLFFAWNPPLLVGLFAQKGVYGLAAASIVPITFGVFFDKSLTAVQVAVCSVGALLLHLYLNLFGGVMNPSVSATYGIFFSFSVGFFFKFIETRRQKIKILLT